MADTRTFKGGVHPHEGRNGKSATSQMPIRVVKAPELVTIALSQHIGTPCKAMVKAGDEVRMGQMIGQGEGAIWAPVHASVSGKVKAVGTCLLPDGKSVPAVTIANDFEDTWDEGVQPRDQVDRLSAQELLDIVRDAGVVGLGGATFPTAVKLAPPPEKQVDTLILNGAECEPYLTNDHRMMLEAAKKIIDGALLAQKMLGAQQVMIGIEDNKPDAVKALTAAAQGSAIRVYALKTKYPQGGEKQLIYALTGRKVPTGGLPADVATVVINVSTAAAIADAVYEGKPLIERVITVTGKVKSPANLRVRIGTPLSVLLEECGGMEEDVQKIVLGGPMMGPTVATLDMPVVKGTGGILLLGKEEGVHAKENPCMRCGRCAKACPMRLVPTTIDANVRKGRWDEAQSAGAKNCMECGACTYACPAKRELTQSCRMAKAAIAAKAKNS